MTTADTSLPVVPTELRPVTIGLLVGLWILAWALFGNFVRPVGHLAALWPANAMLLGILIRFPATANRYSWIAATIGFVLADTLHGGWQPVTLALTAGNLASVVPAYLLLRLLPLDDQRLRHPRSALFLVCIAAAGAACSGLTGAIIDPVFFGGTPWGGWSFWFVSELVNFVAIAPVMLSLPDIDRPFDWRRLTQVPWLNLLATGCPRGLMCCQRPDRRAGRGDLSGFAAAVVRHQLWPVRQ
jgi:hypothetical protein